MKQNRRRNDRAKAEVRQEKESTKNKKELCGRKKERIKRRGGKKELRGSSKVGSDSITDDLTSPPLTSLLTSFLTFLLTSYLSFRHIGETWGLFQRKEKSGLRRNFSSPSTSLVLHILIWELREIYIWIGHWCFSRAHISLGKFLVTM